MKQAYFPNKTAQDPIAQKFAWMPQWILKLARMIVHESLNRDECRTPMQWDNSENAGFTPAIVQPWLPVTRGSENINVMAEQENQESILVCYKRLLSLRNQNIALRCWATYLAQRS